MMRNATLLIIMMLMGWLAQSRLLLVGCRLLHARADGRKETRPDYDTVGRKSMFLLQTCSWLLKLWEEQIGGASQSWCHASGILFTSPIMGWSMSYCTENLSTVSFVNRNRSFTHFITISHFNKRMYTWSICFRNTPLNFVRNYFGWMDTSRVRSYLLRGFDLHKVAVLLKPFK